MPKKQKENGNEVVSVEVKRDELAASLAETLNKQFKDYKTTFFLNSQEDNPTEVKEWISTGSSILDLRISNRPNGGVPVGKITEITGMQSSGKSLLAAHVLAETQKRGGVAVYIDTESAISSEFLTAIGVDVNNMLYVNLSTIEDVFETMENIITKVRESDRDRLVTIVVDSLAAASTKSEMEGDYDKDGYATSKAILLSKAMRKITNLIARQRIAVLMTNQLRQKLGVMFGDMYTTSGGFAVGFHSSVRIRVKAMGQIKQGDKIIGIKCKAQVTKNRLGPPLRSAEYDMYFDSGINNYGGWLTFLKEEGVVEKSGKGYDIDGKKFQSKQWLEMLQDDTFRNKIYDLICDKAIMKYKTTKEVRIDDVEITSGEGLDD